MAGTTIPDLQVTKVVDGDTINVDLNGEVEKLRLTCIDTEESLPSGATPDKPVTQAGKLASDFTKAYFATDGGLAVVTLEFDTDDLVEVCLHKHRDNFGRLLCYVHKDGENFNLKLVAEGWSPYFEKYGRSRQYHRELRQAEAQAQAFNLAIWDPATNGGGATRPYDILRPWWGFRGAVVEDYRRAVDDGTAASVLSVRLDYQTLLDAAAAETDVTVLCDLQEGIQQWVGGGAVVWAGSPEHKFNLWIPDVETEEAQQIVRLIQLQYEGTGRRSYVYVTGTAHMFRTTPEIVLTSIDQLSDFPRG
jgi:micrococcal nuclease